MMDAKARLDGVREKLRAKALERASVRPDGNPVLSVNDAMEVLTAAGVTLPPQPAGPVTSEEAVAAYAAGYARASGVFREQTEEALANKCKAGMDAAMPLLARDHGLLTPAEVERALSSFDWSYDKHPNPDEIMAALTRGAK